MSDLVETPAATPAEPTPKPLFEILVHHRQSPTFPTPSFIDLRFDEYQLDALVDFVAEGLDAARTEYTNHLAIAGRADAEPIDVFSARMFRKRMEQIKSAFDQLGDALRLIS